MVTMDNISNFYPKLETVYSAAHNLSIEGFNVLRVDGLFINFSGPSRLFEQVFKTSIIAKELPVIKELQRKDTATFIDSSDTDILGYINPSKSSLEKDLDSVALEVKRYCFSNRVNPIPPDIPFFHLGVPEDISSAMNAAPAHRAGYTGKGVRVVMIDSGWYRHPYFIQRGYNAKPPVPGPGATNIDHDEEGHGTGESANIFAIAPDIEFTLVKTNFKNTTADFNTAVALRPDIISCSWGSSVADPPLIAADRTLGAAIANAVRQGIIVVFSAGNGHFGMPGQHPDVISAGGTYMAQDHSLQATPYASGFASTVYPGRNVPDVCGLVGLPPKAIYLMLPVEPGDRIDSDLYSSGEPFPNGDQTTNNDGWAAFSGTSAAAPQLAGICALLKQAKPNLTPSEAKRFLVQTARDVTAGRSSDQTDRESQIGYQAVPGPDLATGSGLADAYQAVLLALQNR